MTKHATDSIDPTGSHRTVPAYPVVRALGLTKVYGEGETAVRALRGVDVEFPWGGFTAIMGPSGSGKSTLMHTLAGLDTATSGSVWIGDQEITGMKDRELTELRRAHVGFVFQAFNLIPTLTAEQNIVLPAELAGSMVDRAWFKNIVAVLGLEDRLTHKPAELSNASSIRKNMGQHTIPIPGSHSPPRSSELLSASCTDSQAPPLSSEPLNAE